jgi:hypothetical protein
MQKGVNVSQSRQGSARSAAILLYSYHLTQLQNALNDQSSTSSPHRVVTNDTNNNFANKNIATYSSYFNSNHFMAKYIEQQLEDQKRLLYLEIPALRNHNSLMRKLRLNLRSESDLSQLDTYEHAQHLIGKSPLHKNLHRKLFRRTTTIANDSVMADVDVRSGVNDLFPNKSTDNVIDLDDSTESKIHYVSVRTNATSTDGGYSNPLAYSSLNDLDDNQSDDYEDDEEEEEDERRDYRRTYVIDNQEIFIGVLPSPASEGPSIAVIIDVMSLLRCNHTLYK